jgi:hypothetical protein
VKDPNEILEAIEKLPYAEPSAGFDAKMRARLDEVDAHRPWWMRIGDLFTAPRVSLAAAVGAAGLIAFVILSGPRYETLPKEVASVEALDIAEDLELFENFEVIEDLDVLDDLELIEQLDDAG